MIWNTTTRPAARILWIRTTLREDQQEAQKPSPSKNTPTMANTWSTFTNIVAQGACVPPVPKLPSILVRPLKCESSKMYHHNWIFSQATVLLAKKYTYQRTVDASGNSKIWIWNVLMKTKVWIYSIFVILGTGSLAALRALPDWMPSHLKTNWGRMPQLWICAKETY